VWVACWLWQGGQAAWAQVTWDAEEYVELTQEGQRLYDEAMAMPLDAVARRQDLLFRSADLKQQGLEMLRTALLTGEVEDQREMAVQDFYTLNENLLVVLLDLDQCAASELLLNQAVARPEWLPEGGLSHLESLRDDVSECYGRVESGERTMWEATHYHELVAQAGAWLDQAHALDRDETRQRRDLLWEASRSTDEAVQMIRAGLLRGEVRESEVTDPEGELFRRYDELMGILLELDLCNATERQLEQATQDGEMMASSSDLEARRRADIAACRRRNPSGEAVAAEEDGGSRTNWLPWALVGVGGTALLAALVVDISSADDRDELEELQAQCAEGPCDEARANQLSDDVDGQALAVGILLGVAVVAGGVATWLLLTEDDEEPAPAAQLLPVLGADRAGLGLWVRF
jgi:hypothetical protein